MKLVDAARAVQNWRRSSSGRARKVRALHLRCASAAEAV